MPRYRRWIAVFLCVASSTASGAATGDADERPLTPREQETADQFEAIARAFSRSADPAIRILFSTDGSEQRADGTWSPHEVVPVAALIDESRGSTDPLVLDLLLMRCANNGPGCDRLDIATRWTQADTQNQVAWLMLATVRRKRGDVDGARETFLRAARASVWHDHYDDAIRRAAKVLPADPSPAVRAVTLAVIFSKAGNALPFEATQTLGNYCKEPGALREACATIVATMVRNADTMMALRVSAGFAARAHMDPSIIATYRQKSDAVYWGLLGLTSAYPFPVDASRSDDPPDLRARLERWDSRVELGERRWAERYLEEQHVSEAEAAKRCVASLRECQLLIRADTDSQPSAGSTRSTTASP